MKGKFRIGEWYLDPVACEISRSDGSQKLTPRAVAVLEQLASRAGEVVTFEEFLNAHWARSVTSPNAVHKVVAELRHALGEYGSCIETIPKRGYRLNAPVEKIEHANGSRYPENETARAEPGDLTNVQTGTESTRTESFSSEVVVRRSGRWMALVGAITFMFLAVFVWRVQSSGEPEAVIVDALGRSAVLMSPSVSGVDLTPASFDESHQGTFSVSEDFSQWERGTSPIGV